MDFGKALEALKKGCKVKLPTWKGYWAKEGDTIKMHCKDGSVLDIRESEDVFYTLSNIASDEWEVVEDFVLVDLNIKTFRFGEALRQLKAGKRVARQGWNGKGMFLYMTDGGIVDFENLRGNAGRYLNPANTGLSAACINAHIDMKAADGTIVVGWLASQTDMLAEDWILVE